MNCGGQGNDPAFLNRMLTLFAACRRPQLCNAMAPTAAGVFQIR
jgi:hypothetical protein